MQTNIEYTLLDSISFDVPRLLSVRNGNGAKVGGARVTAIGINFGAASISEAQTIRIGQSTCTSTLWLSDSHMVGLARSGTQAGLSVEVQAGYTTSRSISKEDAYSYDSPSLSTVLVSNRPNAGSLAHLTVLGVNLASFDPTLAVRAGCTASASTLWASDTSVVTAPASGSSGSSFLSVTVGARSLQGLASAGTFTGGFSFDGPAFGLPEWRLRNLGEDSSIIISMLGTSFGRWDASVQGKIANTAAQSTVWTSDSQLGCMPSHGVGRTQRAQLTMSSLTHTQTEVLSYDAQRASSVSSSNGATGFLRPVTASGAHWGQVNLSPCSRVSGTSSPVTSWRSTSAVTLRPSPGLLGSHRLAITSMLSTTSLTHFLSFDSLSTSAIFPSNVAKTPVSLMLQLGSDFGASEPCLATRMGGTASPSVRWLSESSIVSLRSSGGNDGYPTRPVVLSGSAQPASLTGLYSYDSPSLSTVLVSNRPNAGSLAHLTVLGVNLASFDLTLAVRAGCTASASTLWASDTSVVTAPASGSSGSSFLSVTVGARSLQGLASAGTVTGGFSFDGPAFGLPEWRLRNLGEDSSIIISMLGTSFGRWDASVQGKIANTAAQSTVWTSDSQLGCMPSHGVGRTQRAQLTMSSLTHTQTEVLSYDAQRASSVSSSNGATGFLRPVTASGAHWGQVNLSPCSRVSGTSSPVTSWRSTSAVTLRPSPGLLGSHRLAITSMLSTTSLTHFLSFDSLSTSAIFPSNVAKTPVSLMLQLGSDFGASEPCLATRMGGTASPSVRWLSESSIVSLRSSGGNDGYPTRPVVLSGSAQPASLTGLYSYDSPSLSTVLVSNRPNAGSLAHLTVLGVNLASFDLTLAVRAGCTASASTLWASDTSVVTAPASGSSGSSFLSVTVGARSLQGLASAGTVTGGFSFDGPAFGLPEWRLRNLGEDSSIIISMLGTSFGRWDASVQGKIANTAAQSTVWTSDSQLGCMPSHGVGRTQRAQLTMSSLTHTQTEVLSYDAQRASSVSSSNGATGFLRPVTASGAHWGQVNLSPCSRVSGTSSPVTSWRSTSAVTLRPSPGLLGSHRLAITSMLSTTSLTHFLSFDSLSTSAIFPSNVAKTPVSLMLQLGSDFGASEPCLATRMGGTASPSVRWLSESSIVSLRSSGGNDGYPTRPVVLSGSAQPASLTGSYSYDKSVFNLASHPANGPMTGAVWVSVLGKDFAVVDYTGRARLGATSAEASRWTSDTSIWLQSAASTGTSLSIRFTSVGDSALSLPLLSGSFTFDSPAVSRLETGNVPAFIINELLTPSDGRLKQVGSFGSFDGSGQTRVGGSSSAFTRWESETCLLSKPSPGSGHTCHVQVTAAAAVGSTEQSISFDSPSLPESSIDLTNVPLTGSVKLSFQGDNFARVSTSALARVKSTSSPSTQWLSTSSVIAKQPCVTEQRAFVALTADKSVGTSQEYISADAPSLSSFSQKAGKVLFDFLIHHANSGRTGGDSFLAVGSSLGSVDVSTQLRVASTACESSIWSSTSSVSCSVAAGSEVSANALVTLAQQAGSLSAVFSYNLPTLSSIFPVNVPMSDQQSYLVTAFGSNLQAWDLSPSLFIGHTICLFTRWQSDSSLLCSVADRYSALSNDTAASLRLSLFNNGQILSVTQALSYDMIVYQTSWTTVAAEEEELAGSTTTWLSHSTSSDLSTSPLDMALPSTTPEPLPPTDPGAAYNASLEPCVLNASWQHIIDNLHDPTESATPARYSFATGGLGDRMVKDVEEAWVCQYGHPCAMKLGAGETTGEMPAYCFIYDEISETFREWGILSEIGLD
ncbi:hypothetical protein GUITHDRAFT_102340 [Guillardia theta CCMP2712]|uniref:IPT/TIG domain-containing protein n=1 Tax=Guillardia theta (strain CCMP2712) TaxID=905079 RepID=L1JTU4_GUITC|nr:hypothetical protein GUITHDRAFT_102340 [Guillardia theta CCMP2712]EKX51734.1 hypothetical protein GUITHDRAFT_102340 [Guillardia theta CCMP2712]|eukprot:XP_005838714.1 hypothetical protein GUITHDRAFT_102340 [Guillardia theta CCMP2712]